MISFTSAGWEQYVYWQSQDRKTSKRINRLITDIRRDPFRGLGKPKPLKESYSGYWSRRIDETNRLIHRIKPDGVVIVQCRYHYGDK